MKTGIIGGTVLFDMKIIEGEEKEIETEYGKVNFIENENIVLIQRHGKNIPPHKINHKANISALKKMGVERIIGINSAGSLKEETTPGLIAVPDDFICFWKTETFFDKEIKHTSPGLDEETREKIIETAKKIGLDVTERGVYIQTSGPRFETKAEINMFKNFADFVGMTMASEATLAKEKGIKYASICSIDNFANGIMGKDIEYKDLFETNKKNLRKLVLAVIEKLKV